MRNLDKRSLNGSEKDVVGIYVYALRDPRDQIVFYIGQGTGNRLFNHFFETDRYINGRIQTPSNKVLRIAEVWNSDADVEWFFLAHNINEETITKDAIESAAIDLLALNQNGQAFDQNIGNHSTFLDRQGLADRSAGLVNPQHEYPMVFLFPIHNRLENGIEPLEATQCCWYVTQEKRNAAYAIAIGISDSISRGVFTIDDWHPEGDLFGFSGLPLINHELLDKNFSTVIHYALEHWRFGRYLIVHFNGLDHVRFLKGNANHDTWFELG